MKKISINPSLAKLPFAKFKKLLKSDHPDLDAEKTYEAIGGKLPKKDK